MMKSYQNIANEAALLVVPGEKPTFKDPPISQGSGGIDPVVIVSFQL